MVFRSNVDQTAPASQSAAGSAVDFFPGASLHNATRVQTILALLYTQQHDSAATSDNAAAAAWTAGC
jgi:hypothetical protein